MSPYALQIYTDGSSKVKAGFDAGCAAVVYYPEYVVLDPESLDWSYDKSKIGAMEIQGINHSLQWIFENFEKLKKLNINAADIYCDNQVVVECARKYVFSWADNSWKKRDGGSISNIYSWKKYISLRKKLSGFTIDIHWIKGKSTEETKKVDKLAKKSADSVYRLINKDFVRQRLSDTLTKNKFLLEKYNKKNNHSYIMRIYFHQNVNVKKDSEVKIYFELIDSHKVIGRYYAFASFKLDKKYIDRKNYYYFEIDAGLEHRPFFKKVKKITGKHLENLKKKIKVNYGKC